MLNRFLVTAFLLLAAACNQTPKAPPRPAGPTVRVDVWHDTVCPWCRIGLHNLDAAVAGVQGANVEIVHHPYLLEPNAPPEGADFREHLSQKFGQERVNAMLARVSQAGASFGVKFNWDAVTRSPSTAASHALIDWAPEGKRTAVVAAIQKAHFEDGKDIGSVDVLVAIAREAGLDANAARAAVSDPVRLNRIRSEAASANARGITGVPHYEIGGRFLQGAQSPDAIREAILSATKT